MKKFNVNIILKGEAAASIAACGEEDAKKLVAKLLGIKEEEIEILIRQEKESSGHTNLSEMDDIC